MSDQPRDWDKEMAAIDRAMERLPAGQPSAGPALPAAGAAGGAAPAARAGAPVTSGRHVAATWIKVLIAVALGAAIPFWPYARGCGLWLFLYLGVAGLTVAAGLWAAASTWRHRRGVGHVLALLATLWGFAVAAHEVLPRIGYARESATWACPAPTAPPPPTTQPTPTSTSTSAPAGSPQPATPTP